MTGTEPALLDRQLIAAFQGVSIDTLLTQTGTLTNALVDRDDLIDG